GVARVVDEERHAMLTGHGELVGTLQYMSPEQCAGDPDLVDVRTDVHALGLLLYELLCGRRPYEVAGLPLTEAVQAVVQREPPRPSRVNPDLPRDLEAVIRKALEKDPDRRYSSVAGLADDLRRFLRREPVEASPPGPLHALLLFARRRPAVVFGAIVLAASAAVSAGFAVSARRARDRAEADANTRGQMLELVLDLFERARPNVAQGEEPKVADLFDGVLERIDERLAGPTRAQLQLLATIAKLQQEQYRHAASLPLLDRALELQREHRALRESEDAYLLRLRARARLETGDLDGALADIREAVATFRRTLPADDPRRFQYAVDHANILSKRGELDEAERLLTEVAEDASAERLDAALALANLGVVHYRRGDHPRAESVLRAATGHLRDEHGGATVELSRALNLLALSLKMQGRLEEARPIYEEALETYARLVPDDHRTLATIELNLAALLQAADDLDAASAHLERSFGHLEEADDAALVLEVRRQQIVVARRRGRPADGARRAREAIATIGATPAIRPEAAAEFHVHLGEALLALGEGAEAAVELERAVALVEGRPDLSNVLELARTLLERAREEGAESEGEGGGDD
ncbi:MAG: tetratricopeptide repeat protein, partial [Planctomycetota bacterium JB042]